MSLHFHRTSLVGAIAFAMGVTNTYAQSNNDLTSALPSTLKTLVFTATRSEESIENVPARISVIEPQILEQSPIRELPHLLMSDAAINMVQSGGHGQIASIFTRGTNSTHTLVLRDGVRLNGASAGMPPLSFLDTTDIKQIEVLKGSASVLYGTDAIGGVVQLLTKIPDKNSAFATAEIGEHQTYKTVLGVAGKANDVYAQIRGQRLETDGTVATDAINSKKTDYDQKGYSAKIGIDKASYAASLDYSTNAGSSAYDNFGLMLSQNFDNETVNLKGRISVNDALDLHARLSQFKDDTDQKNSENYVHNISQEAEVYGKWQVTAQQNLLLGIAHKKMEGDVVADNLTYKNDVQSTGYFLQHQYQTNSVNTQVGLRVEDNELFGTHTVGQAAIRYQVQPSTSLYANIGSAFRAPTTNDLYAIGWGANPNLQPEKSISYELGVDQTLPRNVRTGISVFRTEVDNLINSVCIADCDGDSITVFPVYQNNNIDQASMTGAETYLNWQKDELFFKLSYAYIHAKDEVTGLDLARRPRQSATLTAGWQDEQFGISTSVSAKSRSKDFADWPDTTQNSTPGYVITDLHAFWNINPHLKAFSNIQNVGDVKYKTAYNGYGVHYINGGRLASVGLTVKY